MCPHATFLSLDSPHNKIIYAAEIWTLNKAPSNLGSPNNNILYAVRQLRAWKQFPD